jgi:hypothetical protein
MAIAGLLFLRISSPTGALGNMTNCSNRLCQESYWYHDEALRRRAPLVSL